MRKSLHLTKSGVRVVIQLVTSEYICLNTAQKSSTLLQLVKTSDQSIFENMFADITFSKIKIHVHDQYFYLYWKNRAAQKILMSSRHNNRNIKKISEN